MDAVTEDACSNELDIAELVDYDVIPDEVLLRIDDLVAAFIRVLVSGHLLSLELVQRTFRNSTSGPDSRFRLLQSMQARSLVERNGESAFSFVRVFKILEVARDLVSSGKLATQRDIYYRLLFPPIFACTRDVNEAIQDAIGLLRVPRSALGICCSGRGAVVGRLQLQERPGAAWMDCSTLGMDGKAISGDCSAILQNRFRSDAAAILVIEKDAIFQRLSEDRFFDRVPCILVTAKGMPDLATRVFLHTLHAQLPDLPLLGLVDYNPSGVAILSIYKFGSVRMGLEAPRYALPGLAWLGARTKQLIGTEDEVWQALTRRDHALISTLKAGPLQGHAGEWLVELDTMQQSGFKAEIEALGIHNLSDVLQDLMMREDYLL